MSNLRSVLDDLAAVPLSDLSVAELDAEIVELARGIDSMKVLLAERARSLQERGGLRELGYSSLTSYLAHRGRVPVGQAKTVATQVQSKDSAPLTFAAWADGRLSTGQADQLFRLAGALPDVFPDAEEALVEIVEPLDVRDTGRAIDYWRQSVDGPTELDLERQQLRRSAHLSKSLNGMHALDGTLTTLAGECLSTALEALMGPPAEGDRRTPGQRRHDALEDLARFFLEHQEAPTVGGERPHLMLLADWDALRGIAGGTHETIDGNVIDVDTLRAISCDCSVSRIVLGPDSEVVDVGRKTRVWTAAQRRAIYARDRHCQADGCRTRARHCDIHHMDHWADGGSTTVELGILYCRFHHVLEHSRDKYSRRSERT